MSGEVKLGEADYTVFLERLLFMSNILCQISWKWPFHAYCLFKAFCCWKMRKIFATIFFMNMKKPGTYIDYHVKPHLCTKFGDSSLKNEFRNAKRVRLIKWSIMRIFNEAEPP